MAATYGRLQGNRGEATRCGSAASGITANLNTWNVNAYVHLTADDRLTVTITDYRTGRLLGDWTFTADEEGAR